MTTIVFKDKVMAADSRVTVETEAGGIRHFKCEKLYHIESPTFGESIIGVAGDGYAGLTFVDYLCTEKQEIKDSMIEGSADFMALLYCRKGLFEFDGWCRGEKVLERFYAIGSGVKAALGAMHMGASAATAVKVACKVDTLSAPKIVTMQLGRGLIQRPVGWIGPR